MHCLAIAWVIFRIKLWKRHGRKLRIFLLVHFGLITFDLFMGEPKTLISMISGFMNVSLDPKTNYVLSFETTGDFNKSRKHPNSYSAEYFREFELWKSRNRDNVGKDGRRKERRSI